MYHTSKDETGNSLSIYVILFQPLISVSFPFQQIVSGIYLIVNGQAIKSNKMLKRIIYFMGNSCSETADRGELACMFDFRHHGLPLFIRFTNAPHKKFGDLKNNKYKKTAS